MKKSDFAVTYSFKNNAFRIETMSEMFENNMTAYTFRNNDMSTDFVPIACFRSFKLAWQFISNIKSGVTSI